MSHCFAHATTVQPVLSKHQRDNPCVRQVLAQYRLILINLLFFVELKSCLLKTGCSVYRGGHYDRFYCISRRA